MKSLTELAVEDGKTADTPAPEATSQRIDQPQQDANCQNTQHLSACAALQLSARPDTLEDVPILDAPADLSSAHQQDQHAISQAFQQAPDTARTPDAATLNATALPVDQPLSSAPVFSPIHLQSACEQEADPASVPSPTGSLPEADRPETSPPQTLPAVEEPAIDPGPHAAPLATTGTNGADHGDPAPAAIPNVLQSPSARGDFPLQVSLQQGEPADTPVTLTDTAAHFPRAPPASGRGTPVDQPDAAEVPSSYQPDHNTVASGDQAGITGAVQLKGSPAMIPDPPSTLPPSSNRQDQISVKPAAPLPQLCPAKAAPDDDQPLQVVNLPKSAVPEDRPPVLVPCTLDTLQGAAQYPEESIQCPQELVRVAPETEAVHMRNAQTEPSQVVLAEQAESKGDKHGVVFTLPGAVVKAFADARAFIEQHAAAARTKRHVKISRRPEAARRSATRLQEEQSAGLHGIYEIGEDPMDQKFILYDSSSGSAHDIKTAIHLSRTLLSQCSLTYPSAKFFIAAAGKEGSSFAVDSSELFSLESFDAKSLRLFALAGANDIMLQAVHSDAEHHIRMSQEPFSGAHQDEAVEPPEMYSERLIFQGQLHADCLVGFVWSRRQRAEKDAAFSVYVLHQIIAEQLNPPSDDGSTPNIHKDQLDRNQTDPLHPDILANSVIQNYQAWLKVPTALNSRMYNASLQWGREAASTRPRQKATAPGWAVLDAMSRIPAHSLPRWESQPSAPSQDLKALMKGAIDIHAALQEPAPSSQRSAADCAAGSQPCSSAELPQAAATDSQAASEPQGQGASQAAAPCILDGPARGCLERLVDAQMSHSPFSGASCLLLISS